MQGGGGETWRRRVGWLGNGRLGGKRHGLIFGRQRDGIFDDKSASQGCAMPVGASHGSKKNVGSAKVIRSLPNKANLLIAISPFR